MIYAHRDRAIGYDVRGEGPAVLFLHPFPFDRRFWSTSLDGHRVITMDARGFGDSATSEDFTVDDLADDCVALLDHLGVLSATIVGSSMGGFIALALAARHPARVASLVLVGTRAGTDGDHARANREAAALAVKQHGPRVFLDGMAPRLCGRSTSEDAKRGAQQLIDGSSIDFPRALPAMLHALGRRPDRTSLLPTLRMPVLVLVGTEDAITPVDDVRAMKAAIPGAELVELPHAGHLPSLEQPAAFHDALRTFLDR